MIRNLVAAMLEQLGYQALTCSDGADAVALYREALEQGNPFAAVILDMTIPGGMGGMDAAEQIHQLDPDAVLLVSSGYSVDNLFAGEPHPAITGFLGKPYNMEQLATALDRLQKRHGRVVHEAMMIHSC
jgi:DNA-binding NtrC family response regulator